MSYEQDHIKIALRWLIAVVIALVVCGFISMFSSCKTQYVEVEKPVIVEHTTTQHHTDIIRDTLLMRDSVFHFVQGDTTIIEKWHTIYRVEKVAIADTIRDSIPVVTEVTKTEIKEVNKLKWWQTGLITLGSWSALFLLIGAGFMLWRIRK